MIKKLFVIIALVGLFASAAVFFVGGFGLGALNLNPAPNLTGTSPQYHQSALNPYVNPQIYLSNASLPVVSSLTQNGPSTSLAFSIQVYNQGNGCNGITGWGPGGNDPFWYTLQFFQNGGPQSVTFSVNGVQLAPTSALVLSFNTTQQSSYGSQYLFYCSNAGGSTKLSGNMNTGGPQSTGAGTGYFAEGVSIIGQVGSGVLRIGYNTQEQSCTSTANIGGGSTADCYALSGNTGQGGIRDYGHYITTNGYYTSYVDVPVLDGGASARLVGAGPWYNGGQVQANVWTGFSPGGYTLAVYNPGPRGGGLASNWQNNPQTLADNLVGATITFSIPAGASQNCTANGCNQFALVLTQTYSQQTAYFPVNIAPQYTPGLPSISFADANNHVYPANGDTVTISFSAQAPASNATVTHFLLYVSYLYSGQAVGQTLPCGSQWVTSCTGATIQAGAANGGTYSGTYTFTVNQPPNTINIGVTVQAVTGNQQSSPIGYLTVFIQPPGCHPGSSACPTVSNLALWQVIGPIALAAMVFFGVLLIVLVMPGLPKWTIVVMPVVVVVAFGIFYAVGWYGALFAPGGPL
jgi:hypothetical protein